MDTLPGTAGADTFLASINAADATKNTLNSADNLNGGDGTDTLTISASSTGGATITGVTLASVENLAFTNGATAALSFDAALSTGITGVTVTGSTQPVNLTALKAIPTVTLNGNASDVSVGMAAVAVVGTADAATITLNASNTANAGNITINGVETLNLVGTSTSGSATAFITLTDDAAHTLNITGAGGVFVSTSLAGASGTTTGTVTSAEGADSVTISAAPGSAKLSISMGAGNDTVSLPNVVATYTVAGDDGTDTLAYTGSSTSAGPCGTRSPRSQWCSVAVENPVRCDHAQRATSLSSSNRT